MTTIHGTASATIKISALVTCTTCGKLGRSSHPVRIEINSIPYEELTAVIEMAMGNALIQPPYDWAINGRGNYTCDDCLAKR
jgi:hypothetical protein